MGLRLLDQYTQLHFASGVIAQFWGIKFTYWFILHTLFELVENTELGIWFINNIIVVWPGGKPQADTYINIAGDSAAAALGWQSAHLLDEIGNKQGWYQGHLVREK